MNGILKKASREPIFGPKDQAQHAAAVSSGGLIGGAAGHGLGKAMGGGRFGKITGTAIGATAGGGIGGALQDKYLSGEEEEDHDVDLTDQSGEEVLGRVVGGLSGLVGGAMYGSEQASNVAHGRGDFAEVVAPGVGSSIGAAAGTIGGEQLGGLAGRQIKKLRS